MLLALVRHTAPLVAHGVCYGRLDVPLAGSAATDIAGVLERLGPLGCATVWTSPARRCRALAEAVAARARGEPLVDRRLRELDFGEWEGRPWCEVEPGELDRWAADPLRFAAPGGESGAALVRRVAAFYRDLGNRAGQHVIVSHGGPLKILAALAQRRRVELLAPPLPYGAVLTVSNRIGMSVQNVESRSQNSVCEHRQRSKTGRRWRQIRELTCWIGRMAENSAPCWSTRRGGLPTAPGKWRRNTAASIVTRR